ncbi:30S ribosomal protein S2 [Candidatus Uhrbacteria bacterium]|nr:30S ribosomal protein S2 [Candidatus Uhrbacteria bacterium]
MPKIPTVLELLQAGVHFGHKSSRWHPKMEPYLFGKRNGIHVIDLDRTLEKLNQALDYARDTASRGGTILFLGTKRQAQDIIRKNAEKCGMPYVTRRWLGGTLTNFGEVYRLVKRYNDLRDQQKSGDWNKKYTKKEQVRLTKEIAELEVKVGGMSGIIRIPDVVFIVDIKKEKTALEEANSKGIPVIALTDSNVNPERVAYPIPSNDDAVKAIEIMVRLIGEAVGEGREMRQKTQPDAVPAKAVPVGHGDQPIRRVILKRKPAVAKDETEKSEKGDK